MLFCSMILSSTQPVESMSGVHPCVTAHHTTHRRLSLQALTEDLRKNAGRCQKNIAALVHCRVFT